MTNGPLDISLICTLGHSVLRAAISKKFRRTCRTLRLQLLAGAHALCARSTRRGTSNLAIHFTVSSQFSVEVEMHFGHDCNLMPRM